MANAYQTTSIVIMRKTAPMEATNSIANSQNVNRKSSAAKMAAVSIFIGNVVSHTIKNSKNTDFFQFVGFTFYCCFSFLINLNLFVQMTRTIAMMAQMNKIVLNHTQLPVNQMILNVILAPVYRSPGFVMVIMIVVMVAMNKIVPRKNGMYKREA